MPFLIAIPAIFLVEEIIKLTLIIGGTAVVVDTARRTAEAVSSSARATHIQYQVPTTELKTLWDWYCEGISSYEREILHEIGIKDRSYKYTLQELKEKVFVYLARVPGKPGVEEGFKPKGNWDGKLVKNPNGRGYGYPDKDGNVWVPPGEGGHGGAHWDVQKPGGGYDNVYPGGKTRVGKS